MYHFKVKGNKEEKSCKLVKHNAQMRCDVQTIQRVETKGLRTEAQNAALSHSISSV